MLVKKPIYYTGVNTIDKINWDKSFVYMNDGVRINYNKLENVVSIEIMGGTVGYLACDGLMVRSNDEIEQLFKLVESGLLRDVIESGDIDLYFKRDEDYLTRSFVDELSQSDKDEMLYRFIKNGGTVRC